MRAIFKGHTYMLNNTVFSPNGRFLVSGSVDLSLRLWNIRDGSSKVLQIAEAGGFPDGFLSVTFSPNGQYISGGNRDGSLWIWNSRTHRLLARWCGHTQPVCCTEFTPDGKGLMSASLSGKVKYWDLSLLGSQQVLSTGFPLMRSFVHRVRS